MRGPAGTGGAGRRSEPASPARLGQVCAFIDRHFAKDLPVERLAAIAGLSTFHFIRAFRTAVGTTPHQYVRAKRIERAKELLVTTPLPVTEICETVGFRSLGTFSSLFRRLTGEAPVEYRAKRRRPTYIPTCFVRMFRAG